MAQFFLPLDQQPRCTRTIRRAQDRLTLFTRNIESHARPGVVRRSAMFGHDLIQNRVRGSVLDAEAENEFDGRRGGRCNRRLRACEGRCCEPLEVRDVRPVVQWRVCRDWRILECANVCGGVVGMRDQDAIGVVAELGEVGMGSLLMVSSNC